MTEQPPRPEQMATPDSIVSKKRVRASVACNLCRAKRSKCDGLPGQRPCTQCKQRGIQCEIPSKKRNRGHYKPQAEALMRRVQMLEAALAEGRPATSGSPTQLPLRLTDQTSTPWLQTNSISNSSVLSETMDDFSSAALSGPSGTDLSLTFESFDTPAVSGPKPTSQSPEQNDNNSFDWTAAGTTPSPHQPQNPHLMLRPASPGRELDISDIPPSVVDYLLGLFFHKFQLMLKFISQREFMAGRDPTTGEPPPPRSLLFAVLAGALRYSTRPEVTAAYIRPGGENILATAAKKALESEVYSRNISTVQTLLILGEVEIDSGNEMSGFIYTSMASKLILDLSLDLGSCSTTGLTDEQIEVRHWLTWIASVQDQYWTVALQRPLTIKPHVLEMSRLAAAFARSGGVVTSSEPTFESQVNEWLLDLMELAREITDTLYGTGPPRPSPDLWLTIDQLDRRIKDWSARLPERIARGPVGGTGGDTYHFLFVLHLHLNTIQIVMHRHRAYPSNMNNNNNSSSNSNSNNNGSHDSYPASDSSAADAESVTKSRETVAAAAVRIAKLFEMLRHREDIRTLRSTGVQCATLAAEALTNHLQMLPATELVEGVAHLQSLTRTLKQMTTAFAPAREAYRSTSKSVELLLQRLETGDTAKDDSDLGPSLPWADFNLLQEQTENVHHAASEIPDCFASFQGELETTAMPQNHLALGLEDASAYSEFAGNQSASSSSGMPGGAGSSWST